MQTVTSKNSSIILFLIIIMIFSSISMIAANTTFMVTDGIYQGVTVGDIHVGGLSVTQAEQKIIAEFRERTAKAPITAVYQNQKWTITAQEIELGIEADKLAQQAYDVGRNGNIVHRLKERYLAVNKGHSLPLTAHYNHDRVHAILLDITRSIDRQPQNARLRLTGNSFNVEIVPETIGRRVDLTKTIAGISENLNTSLMFTLNISVEELIPPVVASDFAHIDGLIASYTTQFDLWDQNRTQNVLLAAKSTNGILVRTGEVFSFNNIVGLRLAKFGYKEAPGYINGVLVPDWGGGVCQVSSTIYNAALLADLSIEERTAHFRPPGYVPIGQDATVADNQLDFRFKNTLSQNIYITTEVFGNQLIVNIFGKRMDNLPEIYVVATDKKVFEPNTIIKQDTNLELGKEIVEVEGQKGFQVSTYRIKKVDGKIANKEFLASDEFKPVDKVVRVGTKIPPQQSKK
ncbi:VanW family protein [Sporomusa malonica]|uniref:VanW family protein n=1 Tax=Sporomusa malonica TaxID=112901 RepID=UPI001FE9F7C4|nr:VanW family protein [Sporomusa malonica]